MLKYISLFLILFLEVYPQGSVTVNRKSYWDNRDAEVADTSTNIYVDAQAGDDGQSGLTANLAKQTFDAGQVLVNASTDTIFVTGTFNNPFAITKVFGLVLNAVFYSPSGLSDFTYVPGAEGGSVVDTVYSATNSDDVYNQYSDVYDYDYLTLGDAVGTPSKVGIRFTAVTEKVLDDAVLRLTAYSSKSALNTYMIRIVGEDNVTPSVFSTIDDFNLRIADTTSTNYVYHETTEWVANSYYDFTVKTILDELFASYSYSNGNIALFILDNGTASNEGRVAYSYNNSGAYKPKLILSSSGDASISHFWRLVADSVTQVYFGTEVGNTEKSDVSLLAATKDWCFNSDTLYVYGDVLPPDPSTSAYYYVCAACGDEDATDDSLISITEVNAKDFTVGDTVAFKGGETFSDAQLVVDTGIVYTSYGAGMAIIQPTPTPFSQAYAIDAENSTNVTLNNLEIVAPYWVKFSGSSGLTIDDCSLHFYAQENQYMPMWSTPTALHGASTPYLYFTLKNSIITGGWSTNAAEGEYGNLADLVNISESSYARIDSNSITNSNHTLILGKESNYIAIRGNRFYSTVHSTLNGINSNNYIIENNYFERAGSGLLDGGFGYTGYSHLGGLYLDGYKVIFRYNVVSYHGANAVEFPPASIPATDISSDWNGGLRDGFKQVKAYQNRYYNNTIFNNYAIGLWLDVSSDGEKLDTNYVFNNAFVKNGDAYLYGGGSDSVQIWVIDQNSSVASVNLNLVNKNYLGADDDNTMYTTTMYDANDISDAKFAFTDNLAGGSDVFDKPIEDGDSLWVAAGTDFLDSLAVRYNPKGALIDAGRPHTYIDGNQTNDSIAVDDVYCFFSGWGWLDGDSVYINGDRLKITAIDYTNSKLVFGAVVTVLDNESVYYINPYIGEPFKGSEIDIGFGEDTP